MESLSDATNRARPHHIACQRMNCTSSIIVCIRRLPVGHAYTMRQSIHPFIRHEIITSTYRVTELPGVPFSILGNFYKHLRFQSAFTQKLLVSTPFEYRRALLQSVSRHTFESISGQVFNLIILARQELANLCQLTTLSSVNRTPSGLAGWFAPILDDGFNRGLPKCAEYPEVEIMLVAPVILFYVVNKMVHPFHFLEPMVTNQLQCVFHLQKDECTAADQREFILEKHGSTASLR